MDNKELKLCCEFAKLLSINNKKDINKWKEKHFLFKESRSGCDRLATDLETIEFLLDSSTLIKYATYTSEDPFNYDCVFNNKNSKNLFINDFNKI